VMEDVPTASLRLKGVDDGALQLRGDTSMTITTTRMAMRSARCAR